MRKVFYCVSVKFCQWEVKNSVLIGIQKVNKWENDFLFQTLTEKFSLQVSVVKTIYLN